jgi:hypothetical protein
LIPEGEVCRREVEAGRRHYNAVRQFRQLRRRGQLLELLNQYHLFLCPGRSAAGCRAI